MSRVAFPRPFHFWFALVTLTVLGFASARANQTVGREDKAVARYDQAIARDGSASDRLEFHSALVPSDAVAFFFPPITVPPRTVSEPPIPVTPHLPPPNGQPHSSPPPDTAPEPATLISGALGAGLLGLYSLRRRLRRS